MATFVGNVQITNNSGTINFGDTANNSPKSVSKTFSGSGGENSGNVVNVINGHSETNTYGSGGAVSGLCCSKRSRRAKRRKRK
ncbi:hypothetical protein BAG01nite_38780 [Brevibacillus agri]|uniref:Spore germination protein n=1 Tax=Brevibacillus agri TaxID=51101 RepID=A0A3M8BCW6_9BACL|nr:MULTISPECIES: spore germination protein [Brevibacillus]ELK39749.1 hypothetical protein D478_22678 [Brevibacillus agri BAB-2500]EJL45255.1 Spore germination protein gerPA/gerPF [Brevibacillus sp. CF112]MBG9563980.1 spore gernimation protein GerPA [Brevibacillus agri]MBY0052913.1 spore germination protein [Brevibacillus agri]MCG5254465.1 spore germination protein [Brevibacillus agri]